MRGIQWRSSACAGHAAKRRCNALGACVRLPLRGQHRLARLRCRQAPCFPFNCARRSSAREHQNACECRGRCRQRQGKTGHRGAAAGRRDRTRRPAARGRGGRHGRFARAGRCAIVCAAFGARVRIARMQLNGKQEAELRLACAVPATVRRPRAAVALRAPRPPSMPLPQRAGRLRPGKRPARIPADARGERAARRTPGPRGTDRSAVCPRPRASPDPPMPCLSAGPRAARRFVSPAMPRCVPWRAR